MFPREGWARGQAMHASWKEGIDLAVRGLRFGASQDFIASNQTARTDRTLDQIASIPSACVNREGCKQEKTAGDAARIRVNKLV